MGIFLTLDRFSNPRFREQVPQCHKSGQDYLGQLEQGFPLKNEGDCWAIFAANHIREDGGVTPVCGGGGFGGGGGADSYTNPWKIKETPFVPDI